MNATTAKNAESMIPTVDFNKTAKLLVGVEDNVARKLKTVEYLDKVRAQEALRKQANSPHVPVHFEWEQQSNS